MKVIFLDIDGVLNSRLYDRARGERDGNIDESRLPLLKELVDKTNANIVLSSTWRFHWNANGAQTDEEGIALVKTFLKYGITIYDKTPYIDHNRTAEITAWLELNPDVERFVIIDDIRFGWDKLQPNVVNTDYYIARGLEQTHIEKAMELLLK